MRLYVVRGTRKGLRFFLGLINRQRIKVKAIETGRERRILTIDQQRASPHISSLYSSILLCRYFHVCVEQNRVARTILTKSKKKKECMRNVQGNETKATLTDRHSHSRILQSKAALCREPCAANLR